MPRLRSRANLTAPSAATTRPRRGTANQPPPAAHIERSSPEDTRQSIHLTVKASPNKLRKATSGPKPKTAVSTSNIVSGKRASRNSRVIREVDTDEDEDEDEPEAMDVDEEEEDDDDEEDAEGEEDEDAEGEEDDDMEDVTPAPRVVASNNKARKVTAAAKPQDTVEAKELAMDDDDDDEELSELESDEEEEEEEEAEDEDAEGEDEDAEGEEDDELGAQNEEDEEDEDDDMDSDETGQDQTLDESKLTRRQQAIHKGIDGGLMALSNEAQKKITLSAEEHAIRRAEMARRRKNLSEKRNEEEKMDTINRLLKKQPPKRGRKAVQENTSENEEEPEPQKANPLYVRYIQNASGTRLGVPDEWLQAPVGTIFADNVARSSSRPYGGKMVEEVA